MGYRIEYGPGETAGERDIHISGRMIFMSAAVFAVFAAGVRYFWPEGWEILATILFPGDLSAAKHAAADFVQAINDGMGLSEAVMAFCHGIISNG